MLLLDRGSAMEKIRTRIHNTALQNSSLPWNCVFIIARWCRKKFSPNIHSFFFYFLFHQELHFYLNSKVFRLNFLNNLPKRCLFWKNFSFERFWSRLGFKEEYTGCERYWRPFCEINTNLHKIFKNNNRLMKFSGIVYLYLDFTFSGWNRL